MRFITSIIFLSTMLVVSSARAEPWSNKGWVKLGERTVNGRVDRDLVEVNDKAVYSKLTLVVEKSELELLDFEVTFGNGDKWNPGGLHHVFREGTRTRVIDLPGTARYIRSISMKYKNVRDYKGDARVEVWGWKAGGAGAVAPAGKPWHFDSSGGWQLLGERTVNGRADHDRIGVGSYKGKFSKLTLVVENSDLELVDFEIKFGKGAPWHPGLKHVFREGERSRVIDFPGDERVIKFVDFKYRNIPGGGAAKVQVWAK